MHTIYFLGRCELHVREIFLDCGFGARVLSAQSMLAFSFCCLRWVVGCICPFFSCAFRNMRRGGISQLIRLVISLFGFVTTIIFANISIRDNHNLTHFGCFFAFRFLTSSMSTRLRRSAAAASSSLSSAGSGSAVSAIFVRCDCDDLSM